MDTIEKVFATMVITITFIFSVFSLAIAVDTSKQMEKLEKRVVILETKVAIYSGYSGRCDN